MTESYERAAVMAMLPGANQERDLSWFDFGDPRGLSSDGKLLLIGEVGEGGGSHYTTYLRPTDGSPAIRLGEGNAGALTDDDGKYALSRVIGNPSKMYLLPAQGAPRGPFRDGLLGSQWMFREDLDECAGRGQSSFG
jgi:hypothetical protein